VDSQTFVFPVLIGEVLDAHHLGRAEAVVFVHYESQILGGGGRQWNRRLRIKGLSNSNETAGRLRFYF
jgi:hypothetical protein